MTIVPPPKPPPGPRRPNPAVVEGGRRRPWALWSWHDDSAVWTLHGLYRRRRAAERQAAALRRYSPPGTLVDVRPANFRDGVG